MSDSSFSDTSQQKDKKPLQIDEEELKRFNAEMLISDLITPDQIYVDLALVKDFNIGALMTFRDERKDTSTPEEHLALYRSIIDKLPEYQIRKFNDIAHYFPAFKLSNAEIRTRIADPLWSSKILHSSPVTQFIVTLQAQIAVNINHSAVISKRDPIQLIINTYPLQLNRMDRNIVGLYFSQLLKVVVTVDYIDFTKMTFDSVVKYDEIYTYYLNLLFDHEDIREGYTTLKFLRKRLFAPTIFGNEIDPRVHVEKQEHLIRTRCDILTIFTFIQTKLCSALSPEQDRVPKSAK